MSISLLIIVSDIQTESCSQFIFGLHQSIGSQLTSGFHFPYGSQFVFGLLHSSGSQFIFCFDFHFFIYHLSYSVSSSSHHISSMKSCVYMILLIPIICLLSKLFSFSFSSSISNPHFIVQIHQTNCSTISLQFIIHINLS